MSRSSFITKIGFLMVFEAFLYYCTRSKSKFLYIDIYYTYLYIDITGIITCIVHFFLVYNGCGKFISCLNINKSKMKIDCV